MKSLELQIVDWFERKVYGPDAFASEAATLRTLIRFMDNHDAPAATRPLFHECLAALEKGERSSALAAYVRIRNRFFSLGDWGPPATCGCETPESASVTFFALLGAWSQQMTRLEKGRGGK